ncbi:Uncharacterized protein BP5553_01093 [Venustampulla echinocandica]|uniref:Thioesterase/thiol ester dehydrase-isomerase n=1 Tax=Venustampulla echinocandica TaxID=2656787 RepID=A0A370U017_9HELO|nr:Uncharacterized protein BP5553_01093 [Venustampulla echinocandica]RDL41114.1 Uncharacterized protein BP5553_01093 [Venustampulla echinocandica]
MKVRLPKVSPILSGASKPCIVPPRRFCSTVFQNPRSSYSTDITSQLQRGVEATEAPAPAIPSPRWLSDMKARIGKCIIFGLNSEQTRVAGGVLRSLGEDWRDLVAGREGFLVDKKRAGMLRQQVVWGEQDSMSHVNNVTYVRWAESARINWAYNYALHADPEHKNEWCELWTPRGNGLILRSIRTDYKFPMTWPDHISVFHKLRSLPSPTDSHFVLDVMILSELHQRPAARCVEDIVVYDYLQGRKTAIIPFMMDAFLRTWEEQEKEKQRVTQQISMIEGIVGKLENESWNRPDAKEDMGGPKSK